MQDSSKIPQHVREILLGISENPSREGLVKTPERFSKAILELTSGMGVSPKDVAANAIFPCDSTALVLQKDIEFFSLCEHHLLPFFGSVHFAYIPNGKILGLSKIPRVIDVLAKRLQLQEQLTEQLVTYLTEILEPKGIAVVVEAEHFCMMMRGVKKQNSKTITSLFTGIFNEDQKLRGDFYQAIK